MVRAKHSQSLKDEIEVWRFARQVGRRKGLKPERVDELGRILIEAFIASASGKLGIRKATSIALRFIGTALDVTDE